MKCLLFCVALLLVSPPLAAAEGKAAPDADADEGWTYAPGVPDSMAEVRKKPKKNKKTKEMMPAAHPVLVWVPEKSEQLKALLMIVANSDSKEFGMSEPVRSVAAKHDMAVVYMRFPLQNRMEQTQDLLDHIAAHTQIEEFSHAPWVTFGKSSMGKHAFYPMWKNPDRTIATITYHGETPTWPMEEWSELGEQTILHCSANGFTEWGGTFANHVRPSLLNYRKHTNYLGHQAVGWGIGHGDYIDGGGSPGWGKHFPGKIHCVDTWKYLSIFMDKALSLRLPEGYPTAEMLPLKQVDVSKGLLIKPYAIEDMLQVARLPLVKTDGGDFVVNPKGPSTNGFAEVEPATDYTPGEGVPVVPLQSGKSPTNWLLVKGQQYPMEADPMVDQSLFKDLRPVPGDALIIDGKETSFAPISEKEVGNRKGGAGGLTMTAGLQPGKWPNRGLTVIGYTVLDVPADGLYKVAAGFSQAVRVQMVLNGQRVDHKQVVSLKKGLYPLVLAIRFKGASWGHIEPAFITASDQEVAEAKGSQAKKAAIEAELKKRFANGALDPKTLILDYDQVSEAERSDYLWMADREQAEAWIWYHDIERLRREKAAAN